MTCRPRNVTVQTDTNKQTAVLETSIAAADIAINEGAINGFDIHP